MANHLKDDELIAFASGDASGFASGDASGSASGDASGPVHLTECEHCRARLGEFERTLELTAASPVETEWNSLLTSGFLHRVRRGIEQQRHPRQSMWWRPALAGGVVSLVLFLSVQFALREIAPYGTELSTVVMSTPAPDSSQIPVIASDRESLTMAESLMRENEPLLLENESPTMEIGAVDEELLSLIDAYLIDTASEDELLLTLGDLSDESLVAVVEL